MIVKLLEVGIRLIWTQSTASITSNLTRSTIFFLFPCPHPRFVLKKEKEKKNEFECKPFILYDGWKNIKKPRQLIFLHHTHTYQRYAIDTNP